MAHKKAGGSSRNGRDSKGRRRGVKKYGGQVSVRRGYKGRTFISVLPPAEAAQ